MLIQGDGFIWGQEKVNYCISLKFKRIVVSNLPWGTESPQPFQKLTFVYMQDTKIRDQLRTLKKINSRLDISELRNTVAISRFTNTSIFPEVTLFNKSKVTYI